jgi:hypothetical protein
MDALGGYGSSSDDDAPTTTPPPASVEASSVPSADGRRAAKALKKAKKRDKERKKALVSSAAPPSLNAPLPAPSLALPSVSELFTSAAATPTFLHLHAADRIRAQVEAAEASGEGLASSAPSTIHQEQALKAAAESAAQEKQRMEIESMTSSSDLGKRKTLASAPSTGSVPKKPKRDPNDGTGGPARATDRVKEKEQAKRGKGQSGIETGWKPEAWMKMRQNFDG